MNDKIVIWKCNNCNKVNFSNPFRHHLMDICECDQSGMDLETYGNRIMGEVTILKKVNTHFNEITACLINQGYKEFFVLFNDSIHITLEGIYLIREFEDEIIKDYIKEVTK